MHYKRNGDGKISLSVAGNLVVHSVGTEVLIHGMQNATHLNGQTGRIVNMRYLLERYFCKN